jgi:hypothetical protein
MEDSRRALKGITSKQTVMRFEQQVPNHARLARVPYARLNSRPARAPVRRRKNVLKKAPALIALNPSRGL